MGGMGPRFDGCILRVMRLEEDELAIEEVERRRELRGLLPGLTITLLAPRAASFEAVEASRQSFFVPVGDPEVFRLGEIFDARVQHRERAAQCRLEVIRKEIDPRSGIALRLQHIDPENEDALRAILAPVAGPEGAR
jgi:hypothetical protein